MQCMDTNYRDKFEIGVWNDKDLNIDWPKKPIISYKDKKNISFMSLKSKYKKIVKII